MADPAILALLHHLNWSPPAIVQSAPIGATDPKMAAYALYVTRQESELKSWLARGELLRAELWQSAKDGDAELTQASVAEVIVQFEEGLEHQAMVIARKEKKARRSEKGLKGAEKQFATAQHGRLLDVARRFYEEGRDFAAFLRALKAELDPQSRGGKTFEDPADLEKELLGQSV